MILSNTIRVDLVISVAEGEKFQVLIAFDDGEYEWASLPDPEVTCA